MDKEEAIKKLREIAKRQGEMPSEEEHIKADSILLKLIDDEEVEEAYKSVKKWYA